MRMIACLLATLAAALTPMTAVGADERPRSVLFVCQFGTVKSPVARELMKRSAAARGLRLSVAARGITPGQHLTKEVGARLRRDGVDPTAEPLRQLTAADLNGADMVISFDPLPAGMPNAKVRYWDVPPMLVQYSASKSAMQRKIDALADEIERSR